ncbi:hypothetical protein [Streptomyces sp. YIM 98790]|uniref:hypothetical protein n=1 Tax=Streptomyces sp. YIM 98790 TaxID=2689077 RepID=UPI0028BDFA03|nr:hypothetical protein [Streptomyces sp. YIM 98790]
MRTTDAQERRRARQRGSGHGRRALTVLTGLGLAVAGTVATATSAWADETHYGSHNGPRWSLISTGQIDDPLEDVLEHATLFGRTVMIESEQ